VRSGNGVRSFAPWPLSRPVSRDGSLHLHIVGAELRLSRSRIQRCSTNYLQLGSSQGVMRYRVWRSSKDKSLHLLCEGGAEAFNALPAAIPHLGPWSGGAEGEINRLRLPYRAMLAEQGFRVIHAPVTELHLEGGASAHAFHPANTECPECKGKGKGRVPMHDGLRDKECDRCGGRGWIKAPGR